MSLGLFAINTGLASPGNFNLNTASQTIPAGTKIQFVLDLTGGTDVTIDFDPFTPTANEVVQLSSSLNGHTLLFVF